jgi:cell division inhibitor SepF
MAVSSTFKKAIDYLWGKDYDDNYEEVEEGSAIKADALVEDDETSVSDNVSFFGRGKKSSKVVAMPQQQIMMKIAKPTNFDQVDEIIQQLKDKNAVVINLEYVSKDIARRIVDVLCGATNALDGHIEKVSNSIFVVAPINYDIINENTKGKIDTSKFSASWQK